MAGADDRPAQADPTHEQEDRRQRREKLLAELAEARALRKRVTPRRDRLARKGALLRAAVFRR